MPFLWCSWFHGLKLRIYAPVSRRVVFGHLIDSFLKLFRYRCLLCHKRIFSTINSIAVSKVGNSMWTFWHRGRQYMQTIVVRRIRGTFGSVQLLYLSMQLAYCKSAVPLKIIVQLPLPIGKGQGRPPWSVTSLRFFTLSEKTVACGEYHACILQQLCSQRWATFPSTSCSLGKYCSS